MSEFSLPGQLVESPETPTSRCILSLDEDETKRYVRSRTLQAAGFQVVEAATADALRIAAEIQPSLVVLDTRLPEVDGFDVCEKLKTDPRTRAIPVLQVSASGRPESDLPVALEYQSDGYLREPIEPETLVATVVALIRIRELRDRIQRSDVNHRKPVDSAPEGVWVVDALGRTAFVNQRMAEMLKYASTEDLLGRSAFDFLAGEDRDHMKTRFEERLAGEGGARYEALLRCADGSLIWVSISGSILQDEQGRTTGRMALFTDITAQKRAQDALLENQKRLELALEAAELGTWEVDVGTGVVTASERTCVMFDFETAQPRIEDWIARLHPDDRDRVEAELRAAIAGPSRYETEYRVIRPDGSTRCVAAKAVPVPDSRGRTARLVGVAQDVTARRISDQARQYERDLLKGIVENIPVMLCIYDRNLHSFEVNREFERVLGWNTADANDDGLMEKLFPEPSYRETVAACMRSPAPGWRERNVAAKDGWTIPSEWANIQLAGDRMIGIGIDLRERKRAEAELVQAHQKLQNVLNSITDGLLVLDRDWRYTYLSEQAARLIGMRTEDLIGGCVWEVFPHARGTRFFESYHRAADTGKPVHFEEYYPEPLNKWLECHCYPSPDGLSVYFHDITERKQAEAAMRESEAQFRSLANAIPQLCWMANAEGWIFWYNQRWYDYTGTTPEQMEGWGWQAVHDPEVLPQVLERWKSSIATGQPFDMVFPLKAADGSFRPFLTRVLPVRNDGGEITRWFGTNTDIGEQRNSEEALRNQREWLRVTLSSIGDAVLATDAGGRVTFLNGAAASLTGWTEEDAVGRPASEVFRIVNEETREVPADIVARVLKERRVIPLANHTCLVSRDGLEIPVDDSAAPILDSGGNVVGVVLVFHDVTAQRRAADALRDSEAQFRTLANAIPQLCWIANVDGWIVWYNRRWYDYTGTTPEQMEGWGWQSAHDPAVLPEVLERWKLSIATGQPFDMVFPLRGADGVFRPFLTRVLPLRDQKGDVTRWFGTNTDISEQRKSEETLKRQAEMLRLSFEGIFIWRLDGVIESWNLGAERLYGFPEADALGRISHELLATAFPRPWDEIRAELVEKGSWEGELRHQARDAHGVFVSSKMQLIRGADGIERVLEITRDITARRRAEDAVRQHNAVLEGINCIFAAALACDTEEDLGRECLEVAEQVTRSQFGFIGEIGADGRLDSIAISDPGWDACGIETSTGQGKPVGFTIHGLYGRVITDGKGFFTNDPPAHPDAVGTPSGHPPLTAFLGVPLKHGEKVIGMIGAGNREGGYSSQDLEALEALAPAVVQVLMRKKAEHAVRAGEERLRRAQKMESIGLLAGGIAHDFNNLLTGILGNASMVLDDVGPGPAERIREVVKSAERAAHLTRQLLAYSGKGQFIVRDIDVSQAVNEIADLVQFSIPKSVDLAITVQRRLPLVQMDPSQLQQILMNLVINAGEAIGEGNPGRITIATSLRDVEQPFADAIGEDVQPGRYICFEVADTGSGIDQETRSKIFDPFYTTKFAGRGLGLAAVAGILRTQKGAILLDSVPGRGSTFRVLLPAAHYETQASEGEPGENGREALLVVDDEPTVRSFIGAVFRRRGYRVLLASDGREALAICERESREIAAAIVDIVMPLMGANELLPELRALYPGTRILLTSGYSEVEARRLCAAFPGAAFLQKPYTAARISKAIEDLLGPAPGERRN